MESCFKSNLTAFRNFTVFSSFTDAELELLVPFSMLKYYKKGSCICKQGEPNKWIYFIISGALLYTRDVRNQLFNDEPRDVIVQMFGYGEAIGDATVFSEFLYRGNVRTAKDSALLLVDREAFAKLAQNNCKTLEILYLNTASKMFKIVEGIDVAYGKLIRRIDSLADQCASVGIDLYTHFNKTDIARMLGLSRVSVTNMLNEQKYNRKQ